MSPLIRVSVEGGRHVCSYTTDGRTFHGLGCSHDTPREAVDHAKARQADPEAYPPEEPAPTAVDWSREGIE
jgi:hypothetical protein